MPKADTAETNESEADLAEGAAEEIRSDLHPKHQQSLLDAYQKADWLCGTLSENQYIKIPSHLKRIRRSLQTVLTEQELLEHLFVCTYCRYETWESDTPGRGQKACPDCDELLEHANTRTADTTTE